MVRSPSFLSRIENGESRVNERTDKILLEKFKQELQEILASWKYSNVPSKIVATVTDNEWEADLTAA